MRIIAAFALTVIASATPAAAAGLWSSGKADRVEAIVERYLDHNQPMALSVGVSLDGELVVARGWGEARPGLKADVDTLYQIGSLTKQFTAAGVLTLMEREAEKPAATALSLDRPLRDLFGRATAWEVAGAPPITVRSLLTMTSNLPNFTKQPPPETDPWGAIPASRLLTEVKKLTPNGWPNSFSYSNTSYFLLSEIIEMRAPPASRGVDASAYREFLQTELFQPAGMTRTGFAGHVPAAEVAVPQRRRDIGFDKPDWFKGSGDIVSSVADIFAWDKALMQGNVVSPETRELMFSRQAPITPLLAYGMGFYVERVPGLRIFSHSGTVPGYTAFNAIIVELGKPGWISVTILTNSDGLEDLPKLADELAVVALE
jgi:D-alanyl-D-alanine carboxypeptidase